MKKINLIIIFSLLIVSWSFQCNDEPVQVCGENVLNFELNLSISPLKNTYKIGDTIWMGMIIPANVININTNENINCTFYDFKIRSGLNRMDTAETPRAYHEFDIVQKVGFYEVFNVNSNGAYGKLSTEINNEEQELLIGLVPKISGLFQISFYILSDDLKCQELKSSEKDLNSISVSFKMNSGDAEVNNYSLLSNSPGPVGTREQFEIAGGFAFQVTD